MMSESDGWGMLIAFGAMAIGMPAPMIAISHLAPQTRACGALRPIERLERRRRRG